MRPPHPLQLMELEQELEERGRQLEVFHNREGQWRKYIEDLQQKYEKLMNEAGETDLGDRYLRGVMKKKATMMLSRFSRRMKAQSEAGKMRLAVQWWQHNKTMLFKNKMTGQLRAAQQQHALQGLGAMLREFTLAAQLLAITHWWASYLGARSTEQVLHTANEAMLDGLTRAKSSSGSMIRFIFQRMQNFAYKRFIVNWRVNLRSQLALDASFARHEARQEELLSREQAKDRGFRFIWKTVSRWLNKECIPCIRNWQLALLAAKESGKLQESSHHLEALWAKKVVEEKAALQQHYEAQLDELQRRCEEALLRKDAELLHLHQFKEDQEARAAVEARAEEQQKAELKVLTEAHSQEVERVRQRLLEFDEASQAAAARVKELEEALESEKQTAIEREKRAVGPSAIEEQQRREMETLRRDCEGLQSEVRNQKQSLQESEQRARQLDDLKVDATQKAKSRAAELEGELRERTAELERSVQEVERLAKSQEDDAEEEPGLSEGERPFAMERVKLNRKIETLCIRSSVLEATIEALTKEVATSAVQAETIQNHANIAAMVGRGCFKAYQKCWAFNAWRPVLRRKRHEEELADLEGANHSLRHHIRLCESKLQNMEQQLRLVQALKPKTNEPNPWPQHPMNVQPGTHEGPKQGGIARLKLPVDTAQAAEVSRVWERDQALLREMLERGQARGA